MWKRWICVSQGKFHYYTYALKLHNSEIKRQKQVENVGKGRGLTQVTHYEFLRQP